MGAFCKVKSPTKNRVISILSGGFGGMGVIFIFKKEIINNKYI